MLTPENTPYREFEVNFAASLSHELSEEQRDLILRNAVSIGIKTFSKIPVAAQPASPLSITAAISPPELPPVVPKGAPPIIMRKTPWKPVAPLVKPKQWGKWNDTQFMALTRDTQTWVNQRISTGESVKDWYDVRPHLLPLYTLAKYVNWPDTREDQPKTPPVVLEIGVRHGISTMALLTAMRETGGRLISLEIDPEWAMDALDCVRRANLEPWWDLQIVDSAAYKLPEQLTLDLLWIDGSHQEEDVRRDFIRYAPRVRQGGFIAMHDYYYLVDATDEKDSGVKRIVEEARATRAYEILVLPWSHGLVLMRVL